MSTPYSKQTKEQRRKGAHYRKKWRNANPERIAKYNRAGRLKHKYGLSPSQWNSLFVAQGRTCAACGTKSPGSKKGWHTDHIHGTVPPIIRGILCHHCNAALIEAATPTWLRSLASYLEKPYDR